MTDFTVPVDGAGRKAGEVLTEQHQIVGYVRGLAGEMDQAIDHVSDDTITEAATNAEGDGDEFVLSLFAEIEGSGDDSDDDTGVSENLKELAEKIAQDKTLSAWVDKAIQGQKDVDRSPVFVTDRLLTDLKPEEVAMIPWPGSRDRTPEGEPTGINNPDIIHVSRRKSDGSSRLVPVSAIKHLIGLQPRVASLRAAQDEIKAKVPDKAKMSTEQDTKVRNLGKQITSATRTYTLAFKLALLKSHLDSHPHIRLDFQTVEKKENGQTVMQEIDGKQVPVRILDPDMSTYCLDLVNRHNEKNYVTLTVVGLTRVNPSQITDSVSWSTMVDKMLARKKPDTPDNSGTKFPMPETVSEFAEVTSVVVHTLEKASMFSRIQVDMAYTTGEQKEQADDLILNIGRIEELAADLLKRKGMRTRLAELRRAQAAKGERASDPEIEAA